MTNPKPRADVTALILAGGRGSRMGNDDKGLQTLHGKPLALHVLDQLRLQVEQVMISANRNLEAYRSLGLPVWHDDIPNYAGPLAGMQIGLTHCTTPYLVCVPCDSPFVPPDLVERLMNALLANQAELAYAVTGQGESFRPHPVFCLMPAHLLPHLRAWLQGGGRKVSAWQATLKSTAVHFADGGAFRNINSHIDLQALEGAQA